MRALALVFSIALPAHADLYRWVDPDSGSVKLSTLPPSDPGVNAELVPFRNPAAPPPQTPAAAAKPKPAAGAVAALEARWTELSTQLTGVSSQDSNRGAEGLRQQMEAYEAVRAELDRLDPAGAARRRSESSSILDRLRQGFAAQFSPVPPGK
ncbi:MAG TPA: DUF4124 domain-containing protein [Burkholderiales bacterium]|jgi:hypothetical protein